MTFVEAFALSNGLCAKLSIENDNCVTCNKLYKVVRKWSMRLILY